jgi:chromosome partitioning protein
VAICNKVAFINEKGGCGKTTSIFHVAGVLSAQGEKVLVIDLDKQRNTTDTFLLNTKEPGSLLENTMFDFMKGEAKPEDVVRKALFKTRGNAKPKYFNVDVMPADIRFEFQERLAGVDIKEALNRFISEGQYTWTLVDTPPSNRVLHDVCLSQIVDFVIVPFSSDFFSLKGYSELIDAISKARDVNPNLNLIGVYLARYMERCAVDQYIRDSLKMFGQVFMDLCIPVRVDIREAVMYGRPLSYYMPKSPSNKAFIKLTEMMRQRIDQFRNGQIQI